MPVKTIEVEGVGPVDFYKRRAIKSIRLSFTANRTIRVTLPMWVPYKTAIDFVSSKKDWISQNMPSPTKLLEDGFKVGRTYTLRFVKDIEYTKITPQIIGKTILIGLPLNYSWQDSAIQTAAQKSAYRAMKIEASVVLPHRLMELAKTHRYTYKSVSVRQLKRRWGSCDTHKNITLNFFLVQLPDDLIDYVLLHELTHTKVLHHQEAFWKEFAKSTPNPKAKRKLLKEYKPLIS